MLWELLKMTSNMSARCSKISCPVIMLSAGRDKIVDSATNEALFQSLQTKKSSKTYEKACHDLMFDPALDNVVQDLVAWMDANRKE
jgi:alpha-beta hydrolase superfamily lysophospholipase